MGGSPQGCEADCNIGLLIDDMAGCDLWWSDGPPSCKRVWKTSENRQHSITRNFLFNDCFYLKGGVKSCTHSACAIIKSYIKLICAAGVDRFLILPGLNTHFKHGVFALALLLPNLLVTCLCAFFFKVLQDCLLALSTHQWEEVRHKQTFPGRLNTVGQWNEMRWHLLLSSFLLSRLMPIYSFCSQQTEQSSSLTLILLYLTKKIPKAKANINAILSLPIHGAHAQKQKKLWGCFKILQH